MTKYLPMMPNTSSGSSVIEVGCGGVGSGCGVLRMASFLAIGRCRRSWAFWLSYLSHPGSVSCFRRLATRRGQFAPVADVAWSLVSIMANARVWQCIQSETRM